MEARSHLQLVSRLEGGTLGTLGKDYVPANSSPSSLKERMWRHRLGHPCLASQQWQGVAASKRVTGDTRRHRETGRREPGTQLAGDRALLQENVCRSRSEMSTRAQPKSLGRLSRDAAC
ncbi:Hypothetical predicted protein [Podarcis lilfordi]|uniref:Uncharacterized protein n=1 Tax=Podarcis lilfordi TaxID=74358 RepID=A0AA35JXM4_9SAUR|nr:Hypothetical predicted protein [Podarcis lilfordi]